MTDSQNDNAQDQESTEPESIHQEPQVDALTQIFSMVLVDQESKVATDLAAVLDDLATLPDLSNKPVPSKEWSPGVMAFVKRGDRLHLAIACGEAMVRYLALPKYVAMVENMMKSGKEATIMLANASTDSETLGGRGQVLARINTKYSTIHVVQGVTGRVIRNPSDIALFDVYHIDRHVLSAYYIAAKFQVGNQEKIETMIASHDGWKAYTVPLEPLKTYIDTYNPGPDSGASE